MSHPIVQLLRPAQWIKNAVVFAPAFFSLWNAGDPGSWQTRAAPTAWASFAVFVAFCLMSSAVYVVNDIVDAPRDRLHPRKRLRPIASGAVSPHRATIIAACLLAASTAPLWDLAPEALRAIVAYLMLQIAYSFGLKRIPLLDVACIAAGFALRVVAGGLGAGVVPSPWLLGCTFLLALFLALCKRRQEKAELGDDASGTRPSLARMPLRALDAGVNAAALATLLCYAAYTQAPSTLRHFGTRSLMLTLPLVAAGIVRYMFLLRRRDGTDRPEHVLLTDAPLLVIIVLYGISVAAVFHFRGILP